MHADAVRRTLTPHLRNAMYAAKHVSSLHLPVLVAGTVSTVPAILSVLLLCRLIASFGISFVTSHNCVSSVPPIILCDEKMIVNSFLSSFTLSHLYLSISMLPRRTLSHSCICSKWKSLETCLSCVNYLYVPNFTTSLFPNSIRTSVFYTNQSACLSQVYFPNIENCTCCWLTLVSAPFLPFKRIAAISRLSLPCQHWVEKAVDWLSL